MTNDEFTKEFARLLHMQLFYKGFPGNEALITQLDNDMDILIKSKPVYA